MKTTLANRFGGDVLMCCAGHEGPCRETCWLETARMEK